MRESLTRARASETRERSPTELTDQISTSTRGEGRSENVQIESFVFDHEVEREPRYRDGRRILRRARGRARASRRNVEGLVDKPRPLERRPEHRVLEETKRIQVGPDRAREQQRVLGDDGDAVAQILETHLGDVQAVDGDGAPAQGQHSPSSGGRLTR